MEYKNEKYNEAEKTEITEITTYKIMINCVKETNIGFSEELEEYELIDDNI